MTALEKTLSREETKLYGQLKKFCRERLRSSLELTAGLRVIRDKKLYREEYRTFEGFCQAELERPARSIYREMRAHKLLAQFRGMYGANVSHGTQIGERILRAFAPLPEGDRAAALSEAVATAPGGKISIKHAEKTAEHFRHADYVERSDALKNESRRADLEVIEAKYGSMRARVRAGIAELLMAINDAAEVGMHLQLVCGHEKIGKDFGRLKDELPFNGDVARTMVALASKLPERAESFTSVAHLLQPLLVAEKVLQLPERTEPQSASGATPLQSFLAKMTLLKQAFKKCGPVASWEREDLESFITETEWIAGEREKARGMFNHQDTKTPR